MPVHIRNRRDGEQSSSAVGGLGWLVTATTSSSLGDGLVLVAFPLLALRYTHDPLLVAGVAFCESLPALLLSLPAGVLADRWPRRTLAVTAEWVRLVIMALFVLFLALGFGGLPAIYGAVLLISCMEQLYQAAAFSALPGMVRPEQLGQANSRLWAADVSGEQFVGQGLGGLALAASRILPFGVDALSFGASALFAGRAIPRSAPTRSERSVSSDLQEGIRWFRGHPVLRLLAPLVGSFALCQLMVAAVIVLYARLSLHISTGAYGVLMAVAAVGNVVGALVAAQVSRRLGAIRSTVLAGLVAGLAYVGLAAWRSAVGMVVFLLVESLAVPVGSVASTALRQRLIPNELLGRVGMVFRVIIFGAMPVGALLGGLLASDLPYRLVFLVAGVLQLILLAGLASSLARRVRADQQVIDLEGRSYKQAAEEGAVVIDLGPVLDLGAGAEASPVGSADLGDGTEGD